MSAPLLVTKLYVPPVRSERVSRPRLIERLNVGLDRKLTLISAPAGFGKTTLLSECAARCGYPVAWVSLDKGDNEPDRFWTYVVAALQTIPHIKGTGLGQAVLSSFRSSQPPPMETLLSGLVNELVEITEPFVLMLDDLARDHQSADQRCAGPSSGESAATNAPGHLQPVRPALAVGPVARAAARSSNCAPTTCASPPQRQPLSSMM